ncbi:XRE family transcriptional regulator [Chitinibacter sp. S2-10]|uniref:XRE family transcriptional regulator n=1 Tax=Chitinibacter sp. S2-10 TaxID=3373597 RepID=UPI00397732B6
MTNSEPHWLQLLRTATVASNIAAVATKLGYSRTSISLVLANKYPGSTAHIEKAVLQRLDTVRCPYVGQNINRQACQETGNGAAPTHNPLKMAYWRACQRCTHKPEVKA